MIEFNFNSQICTTREQSERLLALGLKKETADMFYAAVHNGTKVVGYRISPDYNDEHFEIFTDDIPAWSLHRLIEIVQSIFIRVNLCGWWVQIVRKLYNEEYYGATYNNLYDNLIDCIEWLINEAHLSKIYLDNIQETQYNNL